VSDRTQSAYQARAAEKEDAATIVATFDAQRAKYEGILAGNVSVDVFRNAFVTAVQRDWKLLKADRQSLWLALQKCAGDGLLPDGREAALSIFNDDEDEDNPKTAAKDGKVKKVVYMPMIQGLIKLVRNTGEVASIDIPLVFRGEAVELWWEDGKKHFKLRRVFDEKFDDSPQAIIGAVAIVTYKDGSWEMEAMSRARIERVRAIAKAKKGPWLAWYDEMARKTVLRNLLKRLPKSAVNLAERAMDSDETMETIEGEVDGGRVQRAIAAPEVDLSTHALHESLAKADQRQTVEREPTKQQTAQAASNPVPAQPARAAAVPPEPSKPMFEAWPADEFGEPAEHPNGEPVQFIDPQLFAAWVQEKWLKLPPDLRAGFLEHNADAIADAKVDVIAAKMLAVTVDPAPAAAPSADATPPKNFLEMPLTPGRKPHWPNYGAAAEAAITGIGSVAELQDWTNVNVPTYEKGPESIRMKIDRALSARHLALTKPPEAEDRDIKLARDFVADINACRTGDDLKVLGANAAMKTLLARWRQDRPDLYDMLAKAEAAKVQSFGPPPEDDVPDLDRRG
jgi:phage RecT family recombinase